MGDIIGSAITPYWDSLNTDTFEYAALSSDEWIATSRINAATGSNFSSWQEFFGPFTDGIENFTSVERLPFLSYDFDFSALGAEDPPDVLLSPLAGDAPYAAEDIIMVSMSDAGISSSILTKSAALRRSMRICLLPFHGDDAPRRRRPERSHRWPSNQWPDANTERQSWCRVLRCK